MVAEKYCIEISLRQQKLLLKSGKDVVEVFEVSTALNGPGEKIDSECTPRGRHIIAEKIGDNCLSDTVFVGRQATGEICTPALQRKFPDRDWILSRILRLRGMEQGVNQGGDVDTYQRMIYIHGAPDTVQMGLPGSHGCIRMRNTDVIRLFDRVDEGMEVVIRE